MIVSTSVNASIYFPLREWRYYFIQIESKLWEMISIVCRQVMFGDICLCYFVNMDSLLLKSRALRLELMLELEHLDKI